ELTRRWPILPAAAGEEKDHPHQRSLWFAHGDVNGHDFWTEGKEAGRIVQTSIDAKRTTRDTALIRSSNDWIAASGDRVLRDERVLRFVERDGRRTMDFVVRMIASDGDLVFGDTKEGTMAIRLTPSMRVEGKVAKGHLLMSTGLRDTKAWGTRAAWLHAQGPPLGASDETLIGVVMFDHPQNLRHPSWWHARTYGLLAANPFGIHAFTKQSKAPRPKDAGRFALAADKTLTLRYRFLLHQGALEAKDIEHEWAAYESAPQLEVDPVDGDPLDGDPLDAQEKKR
ncbi:MAG: PmoA family protein, partial [Planctomycetes bacterium]|nr:PmoA family protein [Planctomycetota bacterium]